jgi:hypothetical protein
MCERWDLSRGGSRKLAIHINRSKD